MSFTKSKILAVSVCGLALGLGACSVPNSLPDGYAHHNKPYKSQTPPPSPKFTELQRSTMGPEQADQFRLAVYQLVDNLTNRAGMPPKPIYIAKPERMTPFYANFDNDLRESMRHVGYRLTDNPEGAYVFTYAATILKKEKAAADDTSPNVHIALQVHDKIGEDAKMLTQEEGNFYIKGAETLHVKPSIFTDMLPSQSGPGGNN